jgi:uncharacterized protein YgbK (DUF1537 family)
MIRFGCIADDLTGATDLANELVARGLRTVQVIGVPAGAPAIEVETAAIVVALWTIAHGSDGAPLLPALKSGNFGSDDFFIKAWDHL